MIKGQKVHEEYLHKGCIYNTLSPQNLNAPIFQRFLAAKASSQATFGHCTEHLIYFGQRGTEITTDDTLSIAASEY